MSKHACSENSCPSCLVKHTTAAAQAAAAQSKATGCRCKPPAHLVFLQPRHVDVFEEGPQHRVAEHGVVEHVDDLGHAHAVGADQLHAAAAVWGGGVRMIRRG